MEIKLLQLLNTHKGCMISRLAEELKISSIAVLRLIASINAEHNGLIINQNANYLLAKELNWLDKSLIQHYLNEAGLSYSINLLSMVDSTNSYAMRQMEQLENNCIVSCDWQNAGRGRFGRTWLGSIAQDITVSIVYTFPLEFNITLLPMLSAVAINRLLKNHSIANQIKWPNDIYVARQKVAGILVENLVRKQRNNTVIGIGLNNLGGWERNKLLSELIITLDNLISEFKMFGFALLRREWLDNCLHLNKNVAIHQNGVEISRGVHKDISEAGELIISSDSGNQVYSSSAISLIVEPA